ncbi:unnamed protein product [Blepharisma stoltei]|uniref:WD40 repeat domain-containing protein n=1 Tax=Blepharisma stoltei TaxID=1481888 RepID=A0AAU9IRK5_9CILI|nr:unnamed protein product [Blepharisma stoltei]
MKLIYKFDWEIECLAKQRENLAVIGSKLTGNVWDGWVSIINYGENQYHQVAANRFESGMRCGAWHGGKLYVGADNGDVYCFNQDLSIAAKASLHNDSVASIDKKGQNIVSADSYEIIVWDQSMNFQFSMQNADTSHLKLYDNHSILSIGNDVRIWDIRSKESKAILNLSGNAVDMRLVDSSLFIAQEDGLILQIDLRSENCINQWNVDHLLSSIEVIGSSFAIGTQQGDLLLYDYGNSQLQTSTALHKDQIRSLLFTGSEILTGSLDRTLKSYHI